MLRLLLTPVGSGSNDGGAMPRKGSVDRGLFRRKGVWWTLWVCPYGHEHMEKIGTVMG